MDNYLPSGYVYFMTKTPLEQALLNTIQNAKGKGPWKLDQAALDEAWKKAEATPADPEPVVTPAPKKRGRPFGSKNKPKGAAMQTKSAKSQAYKKARTAGSTSAPLQGTEVESFRTKVEHRLGESLPEVIRNKLTPSEVSAISEVAYVIIGSAIVFES